MTVQPDLCEQVGKRRLVRSLGTSNHAVALTRYSRFDAEMEKELKEPRKPKNLRKQVEAVSCWEESTVLGIDQKEWVETLGEEFPSLRVLI